MIILENINIGTWSFLTKSTLKDILKNIDIDIDEGIWQNMDIDKILY